MKQYISEEFLNNQMVLALKHLRDRYYKEGKYFKNYITFDIEEFQKLAKSSQFGFSSKENWDTGNRCYDVKVEDIDLLNTKYKELLDEQSKNSYTFEYQESVIKEQLEEVLRKKNGMIVKYPMDFDFKNIDLEEIEYIKTLLRLEYSGYINVDFINPKIKPSYYMPIVFKKNIVFTIMKADSIKSLGDFKIDKIQWKLYHKETEINKLLCISDKGLEKCDEKQKKNQERYRKQGFIGIFILIDIGEKKVSVDKNQEILDMYPFYAQSIFQDNIQIVESIGELISRVNTFLSLLQHPKIPRKSPKNDFYELNL